MKHETLQVIIAMLLGLLNVFHRATLQYWWNFTIKQTAQVRLEGANSTLR